MNIKKQYIIQAITNAANNLRLSSEKIEVVTLLREHLGDVENLEAEINRLKKITEFSKLAVRLGNIYNYISGSLIDFNKISDNFRKQSHGIVRELSNLLDVVTPGSFDKIINGSLNDEINIDFTEEKNSSVRLEDLQPNAMETAVNPIGKEAITVNGVTEEEGGNNIELEFGSEFNYDLFVQSVLEPIKDLDAFLSDLEVGRRNEEKIEFFFDKMLRNKNLSVKAGLEIVAKMHTLLHRAFELMRKREFDLSKSNIDSLRACLIVIVAVVRQKDVDISGFLDKTERLNYLLETNLR